MRTRPSTEFSNSEIVIEKDYNEKKSEYYAKELELQLFKRRKRKFWKRSNKVDFTLSKRKTKNYEMNTSL
jgi:hypothetical protein